MEECFNQTDRKNGRMEWNGMF